MSAMEDSPKPLEGAGSVVQESVNKSEEEKGETIQPLPEVNMAQTSLRTSKQSTSIKEVPKNISASINEVPKNISASINEVPKNISASINEVPKGSLIAKESQAGAIVIVTETESVKDVSAEIRKITIDRAAESKSTVSEISEESERQKSSEYETSGPIPINYSLLRDESLPKDTTSQFRRVESIIEKYKDYRKRSVSLESIESAASEISYESSETFRLSSMREAEDEMLDEEIEDEEEDEKEEEDEELRVSYDEDLLKDQHFLDEFDELKDILEQVKEEKPGVSATGEFLQEFAKEMVEQSESEKEKEYEYDSEDEIPSDSDDETFFYKIKKEENKKVEIDIEESIAKTEQEIASDVISIKETSKQSVISFGPRELKESFLSTADLKDADLKKYGSDYEFNYKFLWHKRRKSEKDTFFENEDKENSTEGENAHIILNEIRAKLDELKKKIEDKDVCDDPCVESEEPCHTVTESCIRTTIAPVLLEIVYDVAKQNLFKENYLQYAAYLIQNKEAKSEPTLNELATAVDKLTEFMSNPKQLKELRNTTKGSVIKSQIVSNDTLNELKCSYSKKKMYEDELKKQDKLMVNLWHKEYPRTLDLLSKLANHDILYNPIPKKNLPKEKQQLIDEIIKREKERVMMMERERENEIKLRKDETLLSQED